MPYSELNIDISQTPVLKKLSHYLKLENRDPEIITKVEEGGLCVGFTVMALFGKWLQLEQSTQARGLKFSQRTDDWPWMRATLRSLILWDGSAESLRMQANRSFKRDVDRLFTLIREFQDVEILDKHSQVCTDLYLNDISDRQFIREYSIAGIIQKNKFLQPLKVLHQNKIINTNFLTEVIKEKRLVFFSAYDHILGVIRYKNKYYFYNSNLGEWKIFTNDSLEKMVLHIFLANDIKINDQIAIGIYCLREMKLKPENYLPQEILLKEIVDTKTLRSSCTYQITQLFMAVDTNCLASVRFHLKNPPIPLQSYIDLICTEENKSALQHAVFLNHQEIAEEIVHAGADINLACVRNRTSLLAAVVWNNYELAEFLLKHHADPNIADKDNLSPLDCAIERNNLRMVQLLVLYKCNINNTTYQNKSYLLKAVLLGKYDIAKFLISLPQIIIPENEYDDFSKLYKANHHYPALEALMNKIYFVVLLQKIKEQISMLQLKNKKHYHAAQRTLSLTLEGLNRHHCQYNDILQLIDSMLPILEKAKSYPAGLWKGPKLNEDLVTLIEKFDNNHHRMIP